MRDWKHIAHFFSYSRRMRILVYLLATWFILHAADLYTTYQALSTGRAIEANPLMATIIHMPVIAVAIKMSAAYLGAKVVEKMAAKNERFAVISLVVVNALVACVCLNNYAVYLSLS